MASFDVEAAVTRRLLDVLGLRYSNLADPKQVHGRETGADVQIEHEGRTVGIQATDFSTDEGIVNPRRNLRATEKRNARQGKVTTYSIPHRNQRAALRRGTTSRNSPRCGCWSRPCSRETTPSRRQPSCRSS